MPVYSSKTRYCNKTCQHDHWRRGHKQICKRIHRGGNAEQYHADKKYKEAVAEAVDACADDTKGQEELRDARDVLRARGGSFQRASEEKLRTRRIVSVADRFRHPAATRPTPGSDDSRSTSTDAPPPGSA